MGTNVTQQRDPLSCRAPAQMLPGLCGLEDVGTTQPGWDFDAELPQQGVGKSQACSMEGGKKKQIQGMSKTEKI